MRQHKYFDIAAQEDCEITESTCIYLTQYPATSPSTDHPYFLKGINREDIAKTPYDPETRQREGLFIISNATAHPELFDASGLLQTCPFTQKTLERILGSDFFSRAQKFSFDPAVAAANGREGGRHLTASVMEGLMESITPAGLFSPLDGLMTSRTSVGLFSPPAASVPEVEQTVNFTLAITGIGEEYSRLRRTLFFGLPLGVDFAGVSFTMRTPGRLNQINLTVWDIADPDLLRLGQASRSMPYLPFRSNYPDAIILFSGAVDPALCIAALSRLHQNFAAIETSRGVVAPRYVCAMQGDMRTPHTAAMTESVARLPYNVLLSSADISQAPSLLTSRADIPSEFFLQVFGDLIGSLIERTAPSVRLSLR